MNDEEKFVEEKLSEMHEHPAIQAANASIMLQAIRMSTKGYQGPSFDDWFTQALLEAIRFGRNHL